MERRAWAEIGFAGGSVLAGRWQGSTVVADFGHGGVVEANKRKVNELFFVG